MTEKKKKSLLEGQPVSKTITLQIPENTLSTFREEPNHFGREMRLAAAVKWYEMGALSQSRAAELADMSREEFLCALHRFGVSPFQTTPEELIREVEDA